MKKLKDDKYQSILEAARSEFIRKGFKDASMRNIAREAHVGLSNIYNYFRNKDEIFRVVVRPAMDSFYSFVSGKHTEKYIDFNFMSTLNYQEETIEEYIVLLEKYREELRLLLFRSEGSSLHRFREELTEFLTEVSFHHMALVSKHYPQAKPVSPFFVHALCAFMVSVVGEIITHGLSREKIKEFFREYFRFEIAGWRELIEL